MHADQFIVKQVYVIKVNERAEQTNTDKFN